MWRRADQTFASLLASAWCAHCRYQFEFCVSLVLLGLYRQPVASTDSARASAEIRMHARLLRGRGLGADAVQFLPITTLRDVWSVLQSASD